MKSGEIMALVAPATSAADRKASAPTTLQQETTPVTVVG